nr:RNA-directed DNA polymerase, eukaryota, reverse transcriptase zinc-binding domain protein [Tanacetum cinerariifolium]
EKVAAPSDVNNTPVDSFSPCHEDQQSYDSFHKHSGEESSTSGFSLLERLDEKFKVGLALGLNMEGCEKTLASLIAGKGDLKESKMSQVDLWTLRQVWGNIHFDFASSLACGMSGGVFLFMLPKSACKIALWSLLSNLVNTWDGITVMMGDFNEVREASKRFGLAFIEHLGCNSSFIALIPKVLNAKHVSNFRPISLIGCQYKIIGKLLVNRLSKVIGNCIIPMQSAFIKGRNIVDGHLILNEVLAWYRQCKKDLMIKGCLYNSRSFVLVNGSPMKEFELFRGLRQGDPMSPFIFILAIEGLHALVGKAEALGIFKGGSIGRDNMSISHLMYADDVIFFGIGVTDEEVSHMANIIGCGAANLLLKYLGVPIGCNMARCHNWNAIIKKFSLNLCSWKARLLSVGGRLSLIKSVLGSLPTYYMSIYLMLVSIRKKLESMRNNLFIGGDPDDKKMTWVKWDRCLASRKDGGLGIESIFDLNIGLLFKWVWSLKRKGIDLFSLCTRKIGNSDDSSFWKDMWYGEQPLKAMFPRIFLLDTDKNCSIASRVRLQDWSSVLRHQPRGGVESFQYDGLIKVIDNIILMEHRDSWQWSLDPIGFSVALVRSLVDAYLLDTTNEATREVLMSIRYYIPLAMVILRRLIIASSIASSLKNGGLSWLSGGSWTFRSISKSIFVTNFPDVTSAKELWRVCQTYGTVIDVFIPDRLSRAGKRFAFVRLIRVENVDRLVGSLCTLWIGHMHLQYNVARFERLSVASPRNGRPSPYISHLLAMVLDDACLVERDLENFVMGELKSFSSIPNIRVLSQNEERIVWIDIKGVPLHAWSRATFTKKISRWGEVMELEENKVDFFARKRIYIKTKTEDNISEKFKVVLRSKVFVIRAKELFVWSLVFKEVDDEGYCSDVESSKEGESLKGEPRQFIMQDNDRDEEEVVSETCFGDETDKVVGDTDIEQPVCESKHSSDPFDIYGLLRKQGADNIDKRVDNDQPQGDDSAAKIVENEHELFENVADSSIPFPPGFTPPNPKDASIEHEGLMEMVFFNLKKKGGSILELLDDVIKVGQDMGFSMVGCEKDIEGLGSKAKKDWIRELLVKYRVNFLSLQETKVSTVSDMDVKMFGVILVLNIPLVKLSVFQPSKTKLLVISVYASQALSEKRTLWNFLSLLISRWDGECLVMGDFNEVHCDEERLGTVFNVLGENAFNDFILNSNLLDVRLDGYSFTWSHRSASKMSKLDRFLISDGFHSSFPHMSGICLDRHLSDHRPILFRDVCIDYGATPFRFNGMVRFKKKLQHLKKEIRSWVIERKKQNMGYIYDIKSKLHELDVSIDQGGANADILASRRNFVYILLKGSKSRPLIGAVWGCGEDKSPGPDGFTFEFFRKFWDLIGSDFCVAVKWFFDHSSFSRGCNSLFVALIPKNSDLKFVTDYRHISLIGCLYKVVTKILALRLSAIISGLISDVQTAFILGRQILDGPFIINELLAWCKHYKHQAMVFKVDFAKAYDSVRWDYLMDVLKSFGFGDKWCGWIMGLKQGDPLAPYLFILVMESLHLSFSRMDDVGIFKGIQIGKDITLSYLFYVDDAVFIGECYLLGVGVSNDATVAAATNLDCAIMKAPFKYLGVMVGGNMSRIDAWDETLSKLSVAEKLQHSVDTSFWRPVKGGSESAQLESLSELIEGVILSNSRDRWFWDMNGSGSYRVKEVRNMLDYFFLPKDEVATRWLPHLSIKLNVFACRLYLDRLPTKSNLIRRGIQVGSPICPNCISYDEDVSHIFFKCPLAIEVSRAVCRLWDVVWVPCGS